MIGRVFVLALAGACATHREPEPALFSPQLASDQSIVTGRVISLVYDPDIGYPRIVVANQALNRGYRIVVRRLARTGMKMAMGDSVTAWCRGAAGDLTADSVRVEPKAQSEPQPPAMPPQEHL